MNKAVLCLLFYASALFSQPASLASDTHKLYEAFDTIDIELIAAMMCNPGSVEDFTVGLDQYFQNEQFKFRYVFTKAKYQFKKLHPQDEVYGITFRNVVRFTYFSPIKVESTKEELRRKFKAQAIVYDAARNCFLITYNAKMIATGHEGKWKFAFADATLPLELTSDCIPQKITW